MLLSIFQTVEFYVIMVFLAAAVVGLAAMPAHRGEARLELVAGTLLDDMEPSEPEIEVSVGDDCMLVICRRGLDGIGENGAYSLAVTFIGYDVTIEERLTPGRENTQVITAARAVVPGFARERYHINYRSEATGRSAAFSLNISEGNKIIRRLS